MTSMLPPVQITMLIHFYCLSVYVLLKWALQELEGAQRLLPPFKGEHLERAWTNQPAPISPKDKPLSSHVVG